MATKKSTAKGKATAAPTEPVTSGEPTATPPAPETVETAQVETAKTEKAAKTVPMVREEPAYPGGPVTADVHPAEVENFAAGGWRHAHD